ncbi:MAG: apolipoprotein N-acyltransferase [Sphingomonadales bacterium]|nr:apolipoprotein N-acyltransferase [Sphingomonadales bacterium]MDE2567853.1 apolipoprotein N-acyltransferase [Sphingomonadales bacterium]
MARPLAARPALVAPVVGAAAAAGFQPLALWPLTLLALAWLLAATRGAQDWRHAALIGWLWGLGHFTLGNNWIATAFTYQAQMPAWLGWIAVALLSLYLALFPALAALAARLLERRTGADSRLAHALAFAACWIVSEWLRGWLFTGFPWNPLGAAALGGFDRPGLARALPWLGTYALSGLVVLLAAAWLGAWRMALARRFAPATVLALIPAGLMLLPLYGDPAKGTLPFTLVQPNITEDVLNNPANFESQFRKTALLSLPRHPGERRLVLWPESGIPDFLRTGYPQYLYDETTFAADPVMARERIGRVIGRGSLLLSGTQDLEIRDGRILGARNSVTAIDADGAIRGSYAKAHLVPFGEYLPLRWLLTRLGLSRLVPGDVDFWPGPGPRTLDLGDSAKGGWGRIGVQVCYEIVFSGEVVDEAHRPDFLFNPSNDGWFGAWGPPQHLAQARMRAIEEGLPILRSTTTGISAVIDADGRVVSHIGHNVAGRIDGSVPPAHAPTLFSHLGNMLPLGWAIGLLGLSLVATRRRAR